MHDENIVNMLATDTVATSKLAGLQALIMSVEAHQPAIAADDVAVKPPKSMMS